MSTETHPIQTSTDEKQVGIEATKTGQNESQAAVATKGSNETQTKTNGTIGGNETNAETGSSETPMHAGGPNETATVPNSTQPSNANQTAGGATRDSSAEPPPMLSIFLVNDLQYDIFPVHPGNGSMCYMDPG